MRWTTRSLLVVTVACAAVACGGATIVPMPVEMIGRWETDRVEYADRYFEFTPETVVIGTGGGTRQHGTVVEVSREADNVGLLYTVTYLDPAGVELSMGLYFDDSAGGTLRLENQIQLQNQRGMLWRKVRP